MRLCLTLCSVAIWLTLMQSASACESPFVQLSTGCYYFSDKGRSWYQALKECHNMGAQLISIETEEENDVIRLHVNETQQAREHPNDWWISGTDAAQEGYFLWASDFSHVSYTNWRSGDPNNLNVENCIHLTANDDFLWEDYNCGFKSDCYICEL